VTRRLFRQIVGRVEARCLLPTGLALWLALGAASAQPRPTELGMGQGVPEREADPVVQDRLNEAFRMFRNLLAVTRKAAGPGAD
jgi:hypothetical protein